MRQGCDSVAQSTLTVSNVKMKTKKDRICEEIKTNYQLYLMMAIPFLYILVFKYFPMVGVQIAFRNYRPVDGMWGSEWVGLENFARFFRNVQCWNIIKNTLAISTYSLFFSLPFPLIFALSLEYCRSKFFGKTVQMISYIPHFFSTVILVSMITLLLGNRTGIVNNLLDSIFGFKINFLGTPEYYRSIYVWSGIWQGTGWGSILYISALSAVDPQLHEAAIVDGAGKLRRIWHIDLVALRPTITILIITNLGHLFSVGFDKTFLLQNSTNLGVSEVLSTYEYKTGIGGLVPNYSYASAIGLMTSVINFILIYASNKAANKLSGSGLW